MISDFQSGSPFSAQWYYIEGPFRNVCATQGASFIIRLQAGLNLPQTGVWDDTLQAQLIAHVNSFIASDSSWQTVLSALQQDAAARQVNEMSARTGVWLTYYRNSGRRFDGIQFDPSTIFPAWGTAPANDRGYNGGQIACYDPSIDPDPSIVPIDQLGAVIANSATGVRLEQGRPAPQSSISVNPSTQQTVSPLTVIAISVLIVGVGALIYKSSRSTSVK